MPDPQSSKLVVFLHGYGADGHQAAVLRDSAAAQLPGVQFAAPDAPAPCEAGHGRQWFGLQNLDTGSRNKVFFESRASFDRILDRTITAHGFAGSLDRVVLAGFSQGAVMALDALATGRWPVAAAVSFAGRLVTPDPLTPRTSAKVLLVHGGADDVIMPGYTIEAAARLAACGLAVEHHVLPTVGHAVVPAMLAIAVRFLTSATA